MLSQKDKIGSLGEARVICELIRQDYSVFTQFDGKAPFDLMVYKNGELKRVSVKSCGRVRNGSYEVKINATRINSKKAINIPFDKDEVDILAIYIEPEDKVILIEACNVKSKNSLSIKAVLA